MTHINKRRGNDLERELVAKATELGLTARRAWGSNGQSLGKPADVDCEVDVYNVQCKRRKTLPAYLQVPESCDAVHFRQDRGEHMILLRLDDWLHMVKELKGETNEIQA